MTVKLDLRPEVEAGLLAKAHACGLSLEAYLDHVLQNAADIGVVKQGDARPVKPSIERASDILPTQAQAIKRAKELGEQGERYRDFRQSSTRPAGKKSLSRLFAESPFKGLDLTFERDSDTGRPVTL